MWKLRGWGPGRGIKHTHNTKSCLVAKSNDHFQKCSAFFIYWGRFRWEIFDRGSIPIAWFPNRKCLLRERNFFRPNWADCLSTWPTYRKLSSYRSNWEAEMHQLVSVIQSFRLSAIKSEEDLFTRAHKIFLSIRDRGEKPPKWPLASRLDSRRFIKFWEAQNLKGKRFFFFV